MDQSFIAETRIDDHRSLIISSEPGVTLAGKDDAARFPQGGLYFVRERDTRLPEAHCTYVLANAGSLGAAERLVALFHKAALPTSAPRISTLSEDPLPAAAD